MFIFNFMTWTPLALMWPLNSDVYYRAILAHATLVGSYSFHWIDLTIILIGMLTTSDAQVY